MKNDNKLLYFLVSLLFFSIISISVGFSAMSTTLTVNGNVAFKPVDMIRVVDLKQEKLQDADEISSKYTIDGINVITDINSTDGYASYSVKISNLGEVDKQITEIEEEIFTNDKMEYTIEGLDDGDIIKAKQSVVLKVTFKYKNTTKSASDKRLNAKLKFKFEDYVYIPKDYEIVFDSNGGKGSMDKFLVKANSSVKLPTNKFTHSSLSFLNWNTKKDGSGISYTNEQEIKNINIGNKDIVTLYAQWAEKFNNSIKYDGECIFGGQGVDVQGKCSVDSRGDYVNTGIKPFSAENYQKNFVLKFTLTDVDSSRFLSGKRDTFVNMLYEANDNIGGKYPGVLFRIENSKLVIHASNGQQTSTYAADNWFSKEEVLNKEFKLIRYNDGESIKLYYILGDSEPVLLKDITDLYATFDTPLTFGAFLAPDGVTTERHSVGTLSNISFNFESDSEVKKLLKIKEEVEPEVPVVPTQTFAVVGPCMFNGSSANITGDNCSDYANARYINSGISLFSADNYSKDFDISFRITDYVPSNQEVTQATIMNAFRERTGKGYGLLIRRSNANFDLIARDGTGVDKNILIPYSNAEIIRIVRKNNKLCYSINDSAFTYIISYEKFSAPFDVPLTFGASIDAKDAPFRYIKGTLSDINVTIGTIDSNIQCGT